MTDAAAELYDQAMRRYRRWWTRPCPSCHAQPGHPCRTKNGGRAGNAHVARVGVPERSQTP